MKWYIYCVRSTLSHCHYIRIMIELEGQFGDDGRLTNSTRSEYGVREDGMDLWRARENKGTGREGEGGCDGGRVRTREWWREEGGR